MPLLVSPVRIEVVRGNLSATRAEQVLRFWAHHQVASGAEARRRLEHVVCVRLDGAGSVDGTNSVFAAAVESLGGRQLWFYRSRLPSVGVGESADTDAMLAAAFRALDAAHDPDLDDPAGLGLIVSPALAARRPQAQWQDPPMLHAGFAADGRQLRIGWFAGARTDRGTARG